MTTAQNTDAPTGENSLADQGRRGPSRGFKTTALSLIAVGALGLGGAVVAGPDRLTDLWDEVSNTAGAVKAKATGADGVVLDLPQDSATTENLDQVPVLVATPRDGDAARTFRDTLNAPLFAPFRKKATGPVFAKGGKSSWAILGADLSDPLTGFTATKTFTDTTLARVGIDPTQVTWASETTAGQDDRLSNGRMRYRFHYQQPDWDTQAEGRLLLGGWVTNGDELGLTLDAATIHQDGTWDRDDLHTAEEAFEEYLHLNYDDQTALAEPAFNHPLPQRTYTRALLTQACLLNVPTLIDCGTKGTEPRLTPMWVFYATSGEALALPAARSVTGTYARIGWGTDASGLSEAPRPTN